jgi:hypothetical protein
MECRQKGAFVIASFRNSRRNRLPKSKAIETREVSKMIPQRLIGTIYTVTVKVKLHEKSNADIEHFSTYDRFSDTYSWCPFEGYSYLVVPCSKKRNVISMTLYLRVDCDMPVSKLKSFAKNIIEKDFFQRVCRVSILQIGKPALFLRPHAYKHDDEEDADYRAEKIIDFITHE